MNIRTFLKDKYDECVREGGRCIYAGNMLEYASREELLAVLGAESKRRQWMSEQRKQHDDFLRSIGA